MKNVAYVVLVGLWVLGCGGTPVAAPTTPSRTTDEGVDDGIEVRLGCTLVTRAEIDRELARPLDAGMSAPSREAVRELVVRRRVAMRLAHESGADIDADAVERAMQNFAAGQGISMDELRAELARRGMDESRFRESLADQLRALRIAESAAAIDASELEAEVARRMAASPEQSREAVYAAVAQERVAATAEAAITHRIEELRATRAYASLFGCVERPLDAERP